MRLSARIPKTPGRVGALFLGAACSVSCVTLLGDGLGHLVWFLPLAAVNIAVGALTSERVARLFLVSEILVIFGLLGYQLFQLDEHSHT